MEDIIYNDSPLAEYLEGAGRADVEWEGDEEPADSNEEDDDDDDGISLESPSRRPEYAPRGPPQVKKTLRGALATPLRVRISRQSPIGRLCTACARAVKAKPSAAQNARFLEHFRYTLVASQLLDEHTNQAAWRTNPTHAFTNSKSSNPSPVDFAGIPTSGAIATGVTALTIIWLVNWSKGHLRGQSFNKSKAAVVLLALAIVATVFYVYARRQLLLFIRHQAVRSSGDLVSSLQAFDVSTSSAILLIQEVELVSRGYHLSVPLAPITRLEQSSNSRRCVRLRKSLRSAFAATLPALADAARGMHDIIDEDDLERYLDVYDVNNEDVQQSASGWQESEFEDAEALKALRIYQYRFITLRRLYLCSLLAVQANGDTPDFARWRRAGESMQKLAAAIANAAERVGRIMSEEESFSTTSPAAAGAPDYFSGQNVTQSPAPARQRLREQLRKLASLSTGIRSLQAKMQVLREESQLALSLPQSSPAATLTFLDGKTDSIDTATDDDVQLAELGGSLLAHYDAIGSDLKSLVQAWESGRTGLSLSLERAERRISARTSGISSSGLRSPAVSLGGLTAVDELLGGTPDDALKALEGDGSAPDRSFMNATAAASAAAAAAVAASRGRSPAALRISTASTAGASDYNADPQSATTTSSTITTATTTGADEVFEAVASPSSATRAPRSLGTPQERAARLTEERSRRRQSSVTSSSRRDASNQMIRELEAVLGAAATGNNANANTASSATLSPTSAVASPASAFPGLERRTTSGMAPTAAGMVGRRTHSSDRAIYRSNSAASNGTTSINGSLSNAAAAGAGGVAAKRQSVSPVPRSPASPAISSAGPLGAGAAGRRRPFSMYSIGKDLNSGGSNGSGAPPPAVVVVDAGAGPGGGGRGVGRR